MVNHPRGTRPRHRLPNVVLLVLLVLSSSCGAPEEAPDRDLERGRNALAMARYDWARFYFAADLEAHPERLESLRGLGLGWISGYQGSLTHGVKALESYLERAPQDTVIRLRLARSWLQAGERERAQQTLAGLEDSLEQRLLLTRILLEDDPEAARVQILATLPMAANHFEAQHLAAQVHARLGEDTLALEHARRAAEIDPSSAEVFYLMSQILRRQGNLAASAEALATYGLLRQLPGPGSPPDARKELAVLQQLQESLAPTSFAWKKRFARVLLETGHIAEATPLLEELLHQPEGDPDALLVLAQTAHTTGRSTIAHDLYDKVLERHPHHPKALAQQALLAYETHDFENARQLLDRGLALDAHSAPLHYTAGLLALAQGDEERAVEALTTAVDLVPWLPRYRLTLADVLLTHGDHAAVDRLLTEVPAPDPMIDAYKTKHSL